MHSHLCRSAKHLPQSETFKLLRSWAFPHIPYLNQHFAYSLPRYLRFVHLQRQPSISPLGQASTKMTGCGLRQLGAHRPTFQRCKNKKNTALRKRRPDFGWPTESRQIAHLSISGNRQPWKRLNSSSAVQSGPFDWRMTTEPTFWLSWTSTWRDSMKTTVVLMLTTARLNGLLWGPGLTANCQQWKRGRTVPGPGGHSDATFPRPKVD